MDDSELLRYSRQIMLPEIDIEGQGRLGSATVLVVGLGGLGSPVAMYLAAAGIGRLILNDFDTVDLSNLQRQIVHADASVGEPKIRSAASTLAALNPLVAVETIGKRLSREALEELLVRVDLVLDASDNFATRYLVNDACWRAGKPLVSGAAIRWEGQVALFDPGRPESPCYRCLYPEGDDQALNCAENGVIAPLVGVVGAMQAMEAVKAITGVGDPLVGHILYYDAKRADWRKFKLGKRPSCPVCGS
ncbi:MAG: molybdopterin-synthase adenylyltransferase MoeB [Gammaproteobacteria bacterium]|nr:molybdopterin-synthase adenylyltransferase MoeB [Gammaproteobacteria bacterium]MDE0366159.1 molybdopterin-synthase adenylyltransferase MoeB [Gammaproteobacteria bacterium]